MLARMNEQLRRQYLSAMGIPVWELRSTPAVPATPAASPQAVTAPATPAGSSVRHPPSDIQTFDWPQLELAVRECRACLLHRTRTQTVFGVGNRGAQWLFVGEAPGAEEDRRGEPFVGRAGQLLNAMLLAIGLQREQIFIANVLKCRPPENRDPQGEEVNCCEPYLLRQIELIAPKIIIAMGRFAAHSLLKTDIALGKLRGQRLSYHGTPLIVTYHPAYLLRNPVDKRKVWQDLQLAQAAMSAA